jgi:hypothetical protein
MSGHCAREKDPGGSRTRLMEGSPVFGCLGEASVRCGSAIGNVGGDSKLHRGGEPRADQRPGHWHDLDPADHPFHAWDERGAFRDPGDPRLSTVHRRAVKVRDDAPDPQGVTRLPGGTRLVRRRPVPIPGILARRKRQRFGRPKTSYCDKADMSRCSLNRAAQPISLAILLLQARSQA